MSDARALTSAAVHKVHVALGDRSYDVLVGAGILADSASFASLGRRGKAVIVTNEIVAPLLAQRAESALRSAFAEVSTIVLPDGEAGKNWQTLNRIFDELVKLHCDRDTTLVALGGGVVGDLTGFAAACYMRGVEFVQIPTTLLAQVDSSVGGKTGINHAAGKNLIGSFHQPRLVVADVAVLATLPRRELVAGLAEVIKYGAALDDAFLAWIEENLSRLLALEPEALAHAVRRSCEIKADIVAADELESGRRAVLNFGHTFGHAIEVAVGYGGWLHGEAVGCGMVLASRLSLQLGLIDSKRQSRIETLVGRAGLPTHAPQLTASRFIELMRNDKKSQHGQLRFVLLEGLSGCSVRAVPDAVVERFLQESA